MRHPVIARAAVYSRMEAATNPSQNMSNTPVEVLEAQQPIRIEVRDEKITIDDARREHGVVIDLGARGRRGRDARPGGAA